jgi:adenylosuccinate synthase
MKGRIVPGTCVIGLQWGDEAKGKLVDLLTSQFELVVRYQGGANAGHTVVVGDQTYKLHHIPSGILNSNVINLITPGVVLNPPTILEEIRSLRARGIRVADNLRISDRVHVVFPWHLQEDCIQNQVIVDGENIGTTLRGIGPCYRDKVGRYAAVRLGDMYRPDFRQRVEHLAQIKRQILGSMSSEPVTLDSETIYREYAEYAQALEPHVTDTTPLLLDAVEADRRILFEGAQGALLDIDHGTYPFVTSSNSSGVGVSSGAGVPASAIDRVIGVIKCYTTRVGGGPFPTEQANEIGQHIRDRGKEYGTTTGRPRRCGWFDAVAVRYTARLSGVNTLSLMMLDVLSDLAEIQVCIAYRIDGREVRDFPSHVDDLRRAEPVYETLPGWQSDVSRLDRAEKLPNNARRYIERIGELIGRPVGVVSVGPDRAQTLFLDPQLAADYARVPTA